MSKIEEVRERLFQVSANGDDMPRSDILALLADHARLQAKHETALGAMRRAVIALAHAQQHDVTYLIAYETLSAAIDDAKAVQP